MSDNFDPTGVETVESGVNAQKEDSGISEDKITAQDRDQIDESNIVSGDRSTKSNVDYAKADQEADAAVEKTAGIPVGDE